MERRTGEIFKYGEHTLQCVIDDSCSAWCAGCLFYGNGCYNRDKGITGECRASCRNNEKGVKFIMVPPPSNNVTDELVQMHDATNPLDVQIGGNWYKEMKIQPAEYNYANQFNWFQGEVNKYVARYQKKNGRKDLEKAIHIIEMLIELEYPEGDE